MTGGEVQGFVSALRTGVEEYQSRQVGENDGSAIVATFTAPDSHFLGERWRPRVLADGRYGVSLYQARRILTALGERAVPKDFS